MSTNAPAAIAWDELHTPDRAKAEAFYNALFGWTSTPVEMGPDYTYHLLNRADNGQMFGGSHQQGPDEAGQPAFWLVSLGTNDVDKVTAKASELGATVIMEPADIPGTGRFALLTDPQGATFSALSYADGGTAPDRGQGPGDIVWHQLMTGDPDASIAFYSSLFGFDSKQADMGELKAPIFEQNGEMFADIMAKPKPDAPDTWIFYVEVKDAMETVQLAMQSGGRVIAPPMPLPPIGTIAWLADPTGAIFGILQPSEPAAS
ncbi:MAG TPA: VOC family protein [Thermomicrobiales bacterium]|nr:VOC family protein [Thermomicrobiales bacterium]